MHRFIYSEELPDGKQKEDDYKVCGCGNEDPMFKAGKGISYCEKCLKKLKTKFDKLLEEFYVYAEEYDVYRKQMN